VKIDIIAALMLQRQADGQSLTSQEQAWVRAAVTAGDNDAATALFEAIAVLSDHNENFSSVPEGTAPHGTAPENGLPRQAQHGGTGPVGAGA
jgi:hypothetical protein